MLDVIESGVFSCIIRFPFGVRAYKNLIYYLIIQKAGGSRLVLIPGHCCSPSEPRGKGWKMEVRHSVKCQAVRDIATLTLRSYGTLVIANHDAEKAPSKLLTLKSSASGL